MALAGRRALNVLVAALAVVATGCATTARSGVPPGTSEPDRYLFERGNEALADERWLTAREFFRQVTDTYTQSPYRPSAKLGIGDSYVGEGTAEALVLAINEFQEFLAFYPTHEQSDYAQFRLATAYFEQMRSPQRDQTETRNAIREYENFMARYPNSTLMPEARTRLRQAQDRLSTSEYEVGLHYYRIRWYPGAIDRFSALLKQDPSYSNRDSVYYYLAETLRRVNRPVEALAFFEKLVGEFQQSEYLQDAQERIDELKVELAASATENPL
ncbi:MAG: outer membrane protein assembly factor BamD [Vicinamibacterales bacterium]